MRLPGSNFVQHAVGKGGALVEPGDSELILPPVLSISLDGLGHPVTSMVNPGGTVDRSAFFSVLTIRNGAGVEADNVIATLAAGIWKIHWNLTIQAVVATALAERTSFQIRDPDGIAVAVASNQLLSTSEIFLSGDFIVDFLRSGFILEHHVAATLVGATYATRCCVFVSKIN